MNNELIIKAQQVSSVAELMELAKNENLELSEEKAEELFRQLHKEGELSDNELDAVAGGGCGGNKNIMNRITIESVACNSCGRVMPRTSLWLYTQNDDGTIICEQCESGQIQGDISRAYDMIAERNR